LTGNREPLRTQRIAEVVRREKGMVTPNTPRRFTRIDLVVVMLVGILVVAMIPPGSR
jgi:hypothetical protein